MVIACVIYFVGTTKNQSPQLPMLPATAVHNTGGINRIISLCKHPIPFIVLGLDASDKRLIGINPDAKTGMQSNMLNHYFPDFQNISDKVCSRAFVPNIEEIIKLKPQLILNWKRFSEANAQMQSFGFTVTGVNYDGTDENDRNMVNMVAMAIGRKEKADSIMIWRDSIQQQMKAISDHIPAQKKPRVIFLYNYETLRVGGEKSYENFCINLAGGKNMGAGSGVDRSVNVEQILAWNPDIILYGGWLINLKPEDIYRDPFLADVSAVRNHRVIKMPHWASNESVLIWKWLAEIIQPELFNFNVREDIRAAYAWQYKINLTEADIDEVLFCRENAVSTLYTNFKSKK